MNCTHVWNYAQALAFLFPSLERTMRETDFLPTPAPDGSMAFRTLLPLGRALWNFQPAADGQMGSSSSCTASGSSRATTRSCAGSGPRPSAPSSSPGPPGTPTATA